MAVKSGQPPVALTFCFLAGVSITGLFLTGSLTNNLSAIALSLHDRKDERRLVTNAAPPNTASLDPATQGTNIIINGEPVDLPWQQRGERIGLADIPLMRLLGVSLQNSSVADLQPILWFANRPQTLRSWHGQGYRYLDVTDWAAQQAWQFQKSRGQLHLQVPTGTITAGRRSQNAGGDRLVFEVDRPTLWSLTEDGGAFTLHLRAELAPNVDVAALLASSPTLKTLQMRQVAPGMLQLKGTFSGAVRPRVWSVTQPYRVVIDFTQTTLVPKDILWAPGLRWREDYVTVGPRSFPVYQLWLDLEAGLDLRPIWPHSQQLPGIAPLVSTAQRYRAAAAINGGFFNRNNQLPLGAIRYRDQWISGPILNRGAIAWDAAGRFWIGRLLLAQTLMTAQNQTFTIDHINSGYVQAGIGLYTAAWGPTYTPIVDNEILVTVRQGQVLQQQTVAAAATGAYPIPVDGYVLALRSFKTAAQSLLPGTTLQWAARSRPPEIADFPHAIGAGPLLVNQGQIVVNAEAERFSVAFATQAAPRSVAGVTPDNQLLLAAIQESPGGRGPTLEEAAQILVQLGVQEGLNLDGGNSASLYLGGSLINRAPSTAGRVHSGLGLFLTQ